MEQSSDSDMIEYGDAHRLFLRIITEKRVLTASEVRSTYEFCCNKFVGKNGDLKDFVICINQKIGPMNLTIRRFIQEDFSGDNQCFILINTLNDEATRHISRFSQPEFRFVRKLIELLIENGGVLSITEATNVANHLQPRMKISDAEAFVDRLAKRRWILLDQDDDQLSLGGLAVSELQSYLEDTYGEFITKCMLCSMITFVGHGCQECNEKLHRSCGEKFWKSKNASPYCPNRECQVPWDHVKISTPTKRRKK